ncbi:hypothetical protein CDD81_5466 [Ophiocordyceps australis]|uniref:Glutamate-1-semialdehyde 2,1-aminomutase n=1 Tax=Ophiocordyceps australis TaxID=1399860 RepID=A0A2C5XA23_9HYPO|nr:hypothetical protein CDD81_5466 [Ophiocordyceps australis]
MPSMPVEQDLQAALAAAVERFDKANPKSKAIHAEATKSLPGGNTRTMLYTAPFPLSIKCGKDCMVTTEDGQDLVNLTGEFSAGLFGHSHPVIHDAVLNVLDKVGLNVSACTLHEHLLASEMCQRFALDKVRFTNSGTEANLNALVAARHFTRKRKIVVFGGGYHGGVLNFSSGKAASSNVDLDDWIVAKYNSVGSATQAIRSEGVAAVLVEGMQGASGCIPATAHFLKCIQQTAAEAGAIFILDEVMTSRLTAGGLASIHGLSPDLKTFGKWLGGGASFGAFGGRHDIMAAFDPRQPDCLVHSGTFNNNTLTMHLGYTGLHNIWTPHVANAFTERGERLLARLNHVTEGTLLCFTGCGTIINAHFPASGSRTILDCLDANDIQELKDLFWFDMVEAGFWLARRGYIALILSTPDAELDRFVDGVADFVARHELLTTVDKNA